MQKILPTLRYLLRSFSGVILIGFGVILSCVTVTDLVFHLTDPYNMFHIVVTLTVPFEAATGIYALIVGMVLFTINFKVALANGVSRRTFLLANLPVILLASATFAMFNVAVVLAHTPLWPINMLGHLLYPGIGWPELLLGQTALYAMLMMAGWLVALVYYRASRPVQTVVSLSPIALFGLAQAGRGNALGAVFDWVRVFIITSLGLTAGKPEPYTAVVSMLVWSAGLCGLVYLLLRRAPVKA